MYEWERRYTYDATSVIISSLLSKWTHTILHTYCYIQYILQNENIYMRTCMCACMCNYTYKHIVYCIYTRTYIYAGSQVYYKFYWQNGNRNITKLTEYKQIDAGKWYIYILFKWLRKMMCSISASNLVQYSVWIY